MVSVVAILAVLEGDLWLAQGRRSGRAPAPAEEVEPLVVPDAPPVEPAIEVPDVPADPGKGEADEMPFGGVAVPAEDPPAADPVPGEKGEVVETPAAPREGRSTAVLTGEARTSGEEPAETATREGQIPDKGASPAPASEMPPDAPVKSAGGPGKDETPSGDVAGVPDEPVPEEAPATGRFTTAEEVRPILDATRASWVAVRDWQGEDHLYFTHLEGWRCGLAEVSYAVNGAGFDVWEMEACDEESGNPNAIGANRRPYTVFPGGEVESVTVRITYDDGDIAQQSYERSEIAID